MDNNRSKMSKYLFAWVQLIVLYIIPTHRSLSPRPLSECFLIWTCYFDHSRDLKQDDQCEMIRQWDDFEWLLWPIRGRRLSRCGRCETPRVTISWSYHNHVSRESQESYEAFSFHVTLAWFLDRLTQNKGIMTLVLVFNIPFNIQYMNLDVKME